MNVTCAVAHQDDEMGCLGTLLRYRQSGAKVSLLCVTDGSKGMSYRTDVGRSEAAAIRQAEMGSVAKELSAHYICLGREDGFLVEGAELRRELIEALRVLEADVVFTHWESDYNDDHVTTSKAVTDAALFVSIPSFLSEHSALSRPPAMFYLDPGPGYGFEGTHFVELDEAVLEEKVRLIRLHVSQNEVSRALRDDNRDFADLARLEAERQGSRAMVRYAEVFRPCLRDRRVPLSRMLP